MSTDSLHRYAQRDTPDMVNVPNTWAGLLAWAATRFGVSVVLLAVIGYWGSGAINKVYSDNQAINVRVVTLMENRAISDSKLADALSQSTLARVNSDMKLSDTLSGLSRIVEEIKNDAAEAHRRISP